MCKHEKSDGIAGHYRVVGAPSMPDIRGSGDLSRNPSDAAPPDCLGPDAWQYLKVLLLFHDIGVAFKRGARSLSDVAAMLEARDLLGKNKYGVCWSPATITRHCKVARRYFGQVFRVNGLAPLFKDNGPGHAVNGLTELGEHAWRLTYELLLSRGLVDEIN